jgi:hypothetical protein
MELLWRRRNNEVWLTIDECYQPKMFSVAAENMGGVARPGCAVQNWQPYGKLMIF